MGYKRSELMQKRLQQNRQAILEAAKYLIGQGGIKEAQIQTIAERAGVSSGLVYRYFDNKSHIITEVLSEAIQAELAILMNIANRSMPAHDKLYKAIKTFVKRALNHPKLAYSLMLEPADALVEEARFKSKQIVKDAIEHILLEGKQQHSFDFEDVSTTALCIVGAMTFAVIEPLSLDPQTIDKEMFSTQVASFCLNAVHIG
ncbi:TetR/AcrR family transcriptional regulator [Moraxella nasovis]|uniref:TetR/AcrR family transcriptional regulator n=1 Tax=Moraxella nasovis TaxID=2904121 RepID=UPI001F61A74A|nr:TetR/AcrR family transcriptional regulator [Moraxella nasovis]UNU74042.1 TetR/AcrR family transcriptional regulator [Moraxella nasovis]